MKAIGETAGETKYLNDTQIDCKGSRKRSEKLREEENILMIHIILMIFFNDTESYFTYFNDIDIHICKTCKTKVMLKVGGLKIMLKNIGFKCGR